MAELVFRDAGARQQLNAIVHPAVAREMARRLEGLAGPGGLRGHGGGAAAF